MKNTLFICSEVGGVNYFRAFAPYKALMDTKKRNEDFAIIFYDPKLIQRKTTEDAIQWEYELYGQNAASIRGDIVQAVGWADTVIWMGLHAPESLNLFKWCRLRYPHVKHIMEIDDYLLSSARSNPAAGEAYRYGGDLAKIGLQQMRLSDGLVVSTPTLAELYKPYAKNIHVVENTVDLKLWPKRARNKNLTIGWIGAGSHDDDLGLLNGVVQNVLNKHNDVEFTIVHGVPELFKHKQGCEYLENPRHPLYKKMRRCPKCNGIDRVNWTHNFKTIDKYPKWAASFGFDIGLAPLVDLNFTRGKSNLRWLEYSAMGIPTIASPLNHFVETIKNGETGLIVKNNTEQEWINAIELLIEDEDLRLRIGKNAHREVKENWSPRVMAEKYRKALRGIQDAEHDEGGTDNKGCAIDRRPEQSELYGVPTTGGNPEVARAVCP